jgi:putative ABC transport system permease protein
MLKNYIKIALRNFSRHKVYTAINLSGLTLAVTCCLLLGMYVRQEWSFDRFHQKADRLYRPWVQEKNNGHVITNTVTPLVLGPTLKETYPNIEAMSRVTVSPQSLKKGGELLSERVHWVDQDFFRMFDFPILHSNGQEPLKAPNSVVLTESIARKYFGAENPVGKSLFMQVEDELKPFTVSAVVMDPPAESSIRFGIILPIENMLTRVSDRAQRSWYNVNPETYVLLREGTSPDALSALFPIMLKTALGDDYHDGNYAVTLQPIRDIHLNNELPAGIEPVSNPAYSYILFGVALFILLIACINFMTLSLGRSVGRAQEVGVRKAMGALRGQLMGQFWSEAILMTVFAVVLGMLLAVAVTPAFNQLANQELVFGFDWITALGLVALVGIIGLVAGSYPALVLSGYRPVEVLKGKISIKGDAGWFRRTLVVVQFGLSVFLIAGTIVLNQQLSFLQNTSLGFQHEQTVIIPVEVGGPQARQVVERYRQALISQKEVQSVTSSAFPFAEIGSSWGNIGFTDTKRLYREFQFNVVDPDFIPAYGIKLAQGRNFDPANSADKFGGMIVNEAFVKYFDMKDPLNERLPGRFHDHQIIGVTEDFHYASLHSKVQPLVLVMQPDSLMRYSENIGFPSSPSPDITVRLAPGTLSSHVAQLEDAWKEVADGEPFDFTFLDDNLQRQYEAEQRLSRIVTVASVVSIFIACMGLFGLAILAVSRRTKEIGIRKVLGASVGSVTALLSRDFLVLVLVAILIASPLAWYALDSWLQDFAYRISLQWWVFLLAGTVAVVVAFATVSYHTIRAAMTNPVKSLRSE